MSGDGGCDIRRLARQPCLLRQILCPKVESAAILHFSKSKLASFQLPCVFAGVIQTVGVVEDAESIALHDVRCYAGEASDLIEEAHDPSVELHSPVASGGPEIGAAAAVPPLGLAGVELRVNPIDWRSVVGRERRGVGERCETENV